MRLWIGLALLGGLLVLAGGNGGSDRTTEDPTSLAKQDKDKDVKEKKDPSKKDTIQEYVQSVIKGRSSAHKGSEVGTLQPYHHSPTTPLIANKPDQKSG